MYIRKFNSRKLDKLDLWDISYGGCRALINSRFVFLSQNKFYATYVLFEWKVKILVVSVKYLYPNLNPGVVTCNGLTKSGASTDSLNSAAKLFKFSSSNRSGSTSFLI